MNPYGFTRWILSPVRLPIPPLSLTLFYAVLQGVSIPALVSIVAKLWLMIKGALDRNALISDLLMEGSVYLQSSQLRKI